MHSTTPLPYFLSDWLCCSRSARGARADLHAPKAPKSKAEMEAEAAAEELLAKHREVRVYRTLVLDPCKDGDVSACWLLGPSLESLSGRCCWCKHLL